MSENNNNTNKQQKIYVPGTSVKEHKFDDGHSIFRIGINLEKFAPFVKQYKKENNYINFDISARKEVGPYGDTHSMSLNQWSPPDKNKNTTPATTVAPKTTKPVAKKTPAPAPEENQEEFV